VTWPARETEDGDHSLLATRLTLVPRRPNRPRITIPGTRALLRDALAPLTEEDLVKPYSHYQPQAAGEGDNRPVIGWVTGNTFDHVSEHHDAMRALAGAHESS